MAKDWNACRSGGENFGDPAEELKAAKSGTVVCPLAELGVIRLSGEDAQPFLHNLLTNDVSHIHNDTLRFAGFCTAKGRLLASLHIWRQDDELRLMLSADILAAILKKLSMFVLRSKAKLADASADLALIGLAGPDAAGLLPALGAPVPVAMQAADFPQGKVLRLDDKRFVLAVAVESAAGVWAKLAGQAMPVGSAAWRWLEIAAGQPRVTAATQEHYVPQMLNMELPAVGGVIFTKGCYPGQEIVARTQYLGKIKRRMYRARLEESLPAGTDVFTPEAGDQHCGSLVLVAPSPESGFECLVVVQSSGAEAGEIHAGSPGGPRLQLLPLPYAID